MKRNWKNHKNGRKRKVNAASPFDDGSEFNAAYEKRLAEIRAVPDSELVAVNIDVEVAVTTVLGTLPEVMALRDQMAKLPNFDMKDVDALEEYAEATGEANSRYVTATTPPAELLKMDAQARALRETLHSDAIALANRGLIDKARLAPFTGNVGYRNVAFELLDWANLLRDCWETIQGKTALTAPEIQSAKLLAEKLIRAVGLKEQGPAIVAETAQIRQRAFTLMVKAYDQTRRGVAFLRWEEGDLDTIAPSLYAGRGGRGKRPEPPAPPAPEPTPPAPAPEPPVVTPPAPAANAGHDMPGGSPFAAQ